MGEGTLMLTYDEWGLYITLDSEWLEQLGEENVLRCIGATFSRPERIQIERITQSSDYRGLWTDGRGNYSTIETLTCNVKENL